MTARTDATLDTVIVGFGLAGATLAWRLVDAGQSVLVIDPGDAVTSSRIAAGLVTPITGKQLTLSATYEAEHAAAVAFYRDVEARTGVSILADRTAIRVFSHETERAKWNARLLTPQYSAHSAPLPARTRLASDQAFAMRAAQVDTWAYLEASEKVLPLLRARLDWRRDVQFDSDGVNVLGRRARRIVSAEGFAAQRNPYFTWVPFRAAKGEILTLRLPATHPSDTLHCGIWLAPTAKAGVFKLGATFSWDVLDETPTAEGRAELEAQLRKIYSGPYEVIAQHAAVRPIINANHACMGVHPRVPQLLFFNGLASKGALRAPQAAQRLAAHMVDGTPLNGEEDVGAFAARCPA
jgi:glycine oxidase